MYNISKNNIHFAVSSCFEEQDWLYKKSRYSVCHGLEEESIVIDSLLSCASMLSSKNQSVYLLAKGEFKMHSTAYYYQNFMKYFQLLFTWGLLWKVFSVFNCIAYIAAVCDGTTALPIQLHTRLLAILAIMYLRNLYAIYLFLNEFYLLWEEFL